MRIGIILWYIFSKTEMQISFSSHYRPVTFFTVLSFDSKSNDSLYFSYFKGLHNSNVMVIEI